MGDTNAVSYYNTFSGHMMHLALRKFYLMTDYELAENEKHLKHFLMNNSLLKRFNDITY